MHKTFFNLFLIVIICFLASFIPLNTSSFELPKNILPNFALIKPSAEMETIGSSYETNLNETNLYYPTNIEFTMIGSFDKGTFSLGNSYDLILEAYNNGKLVKKYTNTEFVTGLISTEGIDFQQKYSLNISQENLKLQNSHYVFKIYSTAEIFKDVDPVEISVNYLSNSKYISAKNTVEDGHAYIILYFPDENYEYLVPVSRKVPYASKSIRPVIDNLISGPISSVGLKTGSPIPDVPKVWVSKGTATLYLPNDIGMYDQGSAASQFALNSFVNTLTALDGIDQVKFLKGGKEVETFFHGTYIKDPFEKNDSPKVYLGLETKNDRFLLAPIEVHEPNEEIGQLIQDLFDSLKTGTVNNYHHEHLLPTIPNTVKLLNYEFSNGLLTLNLSDDFLNSYIERADMQKMMLDGILYSFTSVSEINKVSITINGKTVDNFCNTNISNPMTAPMFINIEKE